MRHGWFPVSGLHLPGSVRSNGPNTWSRIEIAFLWDWAENVAETVCSGPVLGLLLHSVAVLEGEVPAPRGATGPYFKSLVRFEQPV